MYYQITSRNVVLAHSFTRSVLDWPTPQTQWVCLNNVFKACDLTSFRLLFVSSYNVLGFFLFPNHCSCIVRKPREGVEPQAEPIKGTGFGKLSRNFSFMLEQDNTKSYPFILYKRIFTLHFITVINENGINLPSCCF